VESELGVLLGETLLKDSMDPDPLLASCGVRGIFFYSTTLDLWQGYLKGWLQHPSNAIRESCLVGLIHVVRRHRFGWEDLEGSSPRHSEEEPETNFFAALCPVIWLVESMICDPESRETDPERDRLSDLSLELLELFPLRLWTDPLTD
jgi:hypothetical protein